jgi:hypothetical protein
MAQRKPSPVGYWTSWVWKRSGLNTRPLWSAPGTFYDVEGVTEGYRTTDFPLDLYPDDEGRGVTRPTHRIEIPIWP